MLYFRNLFYDHILGVKSSIATTSNALGFGLRLDDSGHGKNEEKPIVGNSVNSCVEINVIV